MNWWPSTSPNVLGQLAGAMDPNAIMAAGVDMNSLANTSNGLAQDYMPNMYAQQAQQQAMAGAMPAAYQAAAAAGYGVAAGAGAAASRAAAAAPQVYTNTYGYPPQTGAATAKAEAPAQPPVTMAQVMMSMSMMMMMTMMASRMAPAQPQVIYVRKPASSTAPTTPMAPTTPILPAPPTLASAPKPPSIAGVGSGTAAGISSALSPEFLGIIKEALSLLAINKGVPISTGSGTGSVDDTGFSLDDIFGADGLDGLTGLDDLLGPDATEEEEESDAEPAPAPTAVTTAATIKEIISIINEIKALIKELGDAEPSAASSSSSAGPTRRRPTPTPTRTGSSISRTPASRAWTTRTGAGDPIGSPGSRWLDDSFDEPRTGPDGRPLRGQFTRYHYDDYDAPFGGYDDGYYTNSPTTTSTTSTGTGTTTSTGTGTTTTTSTGTGTTTTSTGTGTGTTTSTGTGTTTTTSTGTGTGTTTTGTTTTGTGSTTTTGNGTTASTVNGTTTTTQTSNNGQTITTTVTNSNGTVIASSTVTGGGSSNITINGVTHTITTAGGVPNLSVNLAPITALLNSLNNITDPLIRSSQQLMIQQQGINQIHSTLTTLLTSSNFSPRLTPASRNQLQQLLNQVQQDDLIRPGAPMFPPNSAQSQQQLARGRQVIEQFQTLLGGANGQGIRDINGNVLAALVGG